MKPVADPDDRSAPGIDRPKRNRRPRSRAAAREDWELPLSLEVIGREKSWGKAARMWVYYLEALKRAGWC